MSATNPSTTSARSVYVSNWQDMVGIWKASQLTQLDASPFGPRLGELHYLRGSLARRDVNQIIDYTGYFRDETNNIKYNAVPNFESEAWFENGADNAGTLTTNYLSYDGAATQPQLQLSRSFVAPPNQPFIVVRYTFTNPAQTSLTFNVLDQVHLNNLDRTKNVHAWFDTANNAFIADMTASGQLFMFLGAFQPADGFQAGDEAVTDPTQPTAAGWYSFDADGSLKNNADLTAADVDLAFQQRVTVAAGASETIYFYIGVCETQPDATAAVTAARATSGDAWFAATAAAYNAWLTNGNQGRRVNFDDEALNTMFDRALIVIKNIQNPVSGAFCATTNPFAYSYKNWVRDSAVAAMGLDASGHHAEAESHWRWLASCQGSDGSWKTTFNMWDSSYVAFVEPEYDSIGAFIYGVYRHYTLTADAQFLSDMWLNVKSAADWILANIQPNGFGQADFSIWEEEENGLEHNSYTQTWYVIGLYATQAIAEVQGNTALAEWYAGGASSIMTALQRPSTWNPPGMWNSASYYNRAVNADNSVQPLIDSSSNVLMALGAVDRESGRAANHIQKVVGTLTKQNYGLCRYLGDMFYYTGAWSPGGNEALGPEPSWPQMSLWVAIFEILSGQSPSALARLQWYASVTGAGYMPTGEAVSNVTLQPLVSTMCEPLTASAFLLAALIHEGQYSIGIIPPVYNAGTAKAITMHSAGGGDWSEWSDVPYFVGPQTPAGVTPALQIKRVYLCNDESNLYLRVDNVAKSLPQYQQQPTFAIRIYSQDFSNAITSNTSIGPSGAPLRRPMSFMVERHSDSDTYQHWSVSSGSWVADWTIDWVIEPQWDPTTGRIEATVPLSAVSRLGPTFQNDWADLLIALGSYDTATSTWKDADTMLIHYRLSISSDTWIYGNIEY